MAKIRNLLLVGAIGAGLAYVLDPKLGRVRRKRLKAQMENSLRSGRTNVERASREVQSRAGTIAVDLQGRAQNRVAQLQRR